jgi:ribonuclease P protein component
MVERENDLTRTKPGDHGERFRRESRLRSAADFQRVRRVGKRRQGKYLTLSFARAPQDPDRESAEPPSTRVGFSVSKRVGDAVTRNRVKRRLREAVRRCLWQVAPGWDMIVTARPEAASADYIALRDDVTTVLAQALHPTSGAISPTSQAGQTDRKQGQ